VKICQLIEIKFIRGSTLTLSKKTQILVSEVWL